MSVAHSPVPWRVNVDKFHIAVPLVDAVDNDGIIVAELSGPNHSENVSNAELIVRAVNSHHALVAALRDFLAKWDEVEPYIKGAFVMQQIHGGRYTGPTIADELTAMRAALALAQAGER